MREQSKKGALMPDPVIVIGGGPAGLAAAARLAKAGHRVELYEQSDTPGGTWAPYRVGSGLVVDNAPAIIGFPAPWRDLFRKSGRPLEAEVARMGYALVPAEPPTMIFADGTELILPTDRGGQYTTLAGAYGQPVAERWQRLLDRLGEVWQTLRGLGVEAELRGRRQLNRATRRSLFGRSATLADLAISIDHQHLGSIIRSVAYRSGSVPELTPAFAAVELYLSRTFGRWQLQPLDAELRPDVGRSSVLVEALAARLALRKVEVHLSCPVSAITLRDGRALAVETSAGDTPRCGGHCDMRSLADLQHVAADCRDSADPTPVARPQPGGRADDQPRRNGGADRTRRRDDRAERDRRTHRELPAPRGWRRNPHCPRLQPDGAQTVVRGRLERFRQLAAPTAGDNPDSWPLHGRTLLPGWSEPIARRALGSPGGVRLPRLPAGQRVGIGRAATTLGTQTTSVYSDVCFSD